MDGVCGAALVVSGDVFEGAVVLEVVADVVGAEVVAPELVVVDAVEVLPAAVVLGVVVVGADVVGVPVVLVEVVLGVLVMDVLGVLVLGAMLGLLTFAVVGVARLCGVVMLGDGPPPVSETLVLSGPPLPLFGANAIGALLEVLPPDVVLTDGDPVEVWLMPGPLLVPPCVGASVGGAYEERLTSLWAGV